ncbi:TolC family protein [Deinococcus sp. Arct2-2]|uniref:TolC family protein n=1 Tax=Deinococcus sp. Arct2-2 TaxID=2568653 RepID=UPI0010A405CD|nr:TolC family protein [Deinococcus sp. Arct2-2]THF68933.1 TolC family protein [Deinococcus sp. Arct2-2]
MFVLLSAALLLCSPAAFAQTAPPTPAPVEAAPASALAPAPALTLAQTLALVRASPGWRSADLQYRSAQLSLDSARARAGLNVTVGTDASLAKVPLDSGDWLGNATLTAQVSASVLPWSATFEGVRIAERALNRAGADLRDARVSLLVQAVRAYGAARDATAGAALAEAQAALAARQLEVARAQRTANLIPELALQERDAGLQSAQNALAQARTAVNLAARALANLLGQSVTLPATAAAFDAVPPLPAAPADVDTLVARALVARPEVIRATVQLADAGAQQRAAQLDLSIPDISAGVQYGQLGSGQGGAGRTVGGSLNVKSGVAAAQISFPLRDPGETAKTGLALSLNASLPVFGSGKGTALASATVGQRAAALALDSARQSVDLDVRQKAADLLTALDRAEEAASALARAQASLTTTRARLEAGLVTPLDVAQAELSAAQAQNALNAATANAYVSSLLLAQASTELDPTLLNGGF